ncbi:hypothetical protein BVRB_8g184190 isoform B [Beta vulgaris subsp. vulgaris]|uniref:uncharacterized protein LOC104900779 isoform X2 n=1 Tax=Beta vulgaris subsp. vulgaris TaxID=3555 RepID=UPI00053FB47C|nr:uncharacterized protein LOC104900779 isoform X2 [Beta vulgaris subsp. vulgaris]KMT04345.1 hypothetical protein BVRB_8g184190 isoform B [Beta vulgaris subsp. vulgaris]
MILISTYGRRNLPLLAEHTKERIWRQLESGRGETLKCSHYMPYLNPEDSALPCVVYCHGNSGCRADANEAVTVLLPANITVFTLDFSGSGLSEGNYVSLGWHEKDDLRVVVAYLRSKDHVSHIGLWGRSMGAVTSLLYGSEDPSISGMVLDSAFSNLFDLMMELVDVYKIRLPKFTVKMAVKYMRRVIQRRAKFDIRDLNLVQVSSKTFIPALFGHADGDKFIQPHHSDIIFKLYAGDKNIIKFDGDHNSSRPQFYYDSVSIFFYNTLHPPHVSSVWSKRIEECHSLKDLRVGAGMDETLLYEIISNLRIGGTGAAASSSSPPTSFSTAKSVGLSTNDMMSNDDICAADGFIQDKVNGSFEECCSHASSNRESWGRCSSLEDTDFVEYVDSCTSHQISPDMPSTSTTPNLGKSPEDKRNAKKKKVPPAALKNSKSEKSEKLGALSQLMRLCILKRVDHHKPCL